MGYSPLDVGGEPGDETRELGRKVLNDSLIVWRSKREPKLAKLGLFLQAVVLIEFIVIPSALKDELIPNQLFFDVR